MGGSRRVGRSIAVVTALALVPIGLLGHSASAALQFVKTFPAPPGEFDRPYGVARDSSGEILVTDSNNHRIQVFSPAGVFLRQWGTYGSGPGQLRSPTAIAIDGSDHVFVPDGARIERFDTSGNFQLQWGSQGFGANSEGKFQGVTDVAVDAAGHVFATDPFNYRIQEFDNDGNFIRLWGWGVADFANHFEICTSGCWDGKAGTGDGEFNFPYGVGTDASGSVFVADSGNNRMQKFDSSGNFVTKWGSSGTGDFGFSTPYRVATDADGNVYVSDLGHNRIQEFNADGTSYMRTIGSAGAGDGQLALPAGLLITPVGDLYVADSSNYRVQEFDSLGAFVRRWGGNGGLLSPLGVATDSNGNVFVVDSGNYRIWKYDADGNLITRWGSHGNNVDEFANPSGVAVDSSGNVFVSDTSNARIQKFDGSGGSATVFVNSGLAYPFGLATDGNDNLYVADNGNNQIEKFDPSGSPIAQFGSAGSGSGQFTNPVDVVVDASGDMYVADETNLRVQKLDPSGSLIFMLGKGVDQTTPGDICTAASGDTCGAGSSGTANGQFQDPRSVALDAAGNLFVTDGNNGSTNPRVQEFDSSGTFIRTWGSQGNGAGKFTGPGGIAIGPGGQIYVTDQQNNDVQSFAIVFPDTSIDTGPSGPSNDPNPAFTYSTDPADPAVSFECRLTPVDATFMPCDTSGVSYLSLADGPYTLSVRATDADGDVEPTPATRSFSIDTTPPGVSVDSGPSGPTKDNTPTFLFSSPDGTASLTCKIDNATPVACSGSFTSASLPDGDHTFTVAATDPAGNLNTDFRMFTVDTMAPTVTITKPADGSVLKTRTRSRRVKFVYDTGDASSFTCTLDGTVLVSCPPNDTTLKLKVGKHTFRLDAVDAATNASEVTVSFRIKHVS